MTRDLYNYVTAIPVLIPCSQQEQDGVANFLPPKVVLRGGKPVRQGGGFMIRYSPVRALRDEELRPGAKANLIGRLKPADQNRLLGLIGMRQALESGDSLQIENLEKAYQKLVPNILAMSWPQPKADSPTMEIIEAATARTFAQRGKSDALALLARLLTRALRRGRLVLWWEEKKQRFLPALYCPDFATALYVRALLGIVGGKALLLCPRCGNPFFQERSDQDYCSVGCREAHRVARWRASKGKSKKAIKRARR